MRVLKNTGMRKWGLGLALIAMLGGFSTAEVFADEISLTIDGSVSIDLAAMTADGLFGTSSAATIRVRTDSETGYTLRVTGDASGELVGENEGEAISSITSATSAATFGATNGTSYNNKWGILPSMLEGVANANYLPAPGTAGIVIRATEEANATGVYDEYTLAIGVRVNNATTQDTYTATVNILATANVEPTYYMHEVSTWGSNLAVGSQITAIDIRDGKEYVVGKLPDPLGGDGMIWMMDNLAFTGVTAEGITMDSTNTNVASDYDIVWAPTNGGDWSYTEQRMFKNDADLTPTVAGAQYPGNHYEDALSDANGYKVGVYYNYCAATAGTYCYNPGEDYDDENGSWADGAPNDAQYDICPAGWHLPSADYIDLDALVSSGDYSSFIGHDYGKFVLSLFGMATASGIEMDDIMNFARTAARLPLSGYFNFSGDDGRPWDQGYDGGFWSSSFYYEYGMRSFYVYEDGVGVSYDDREDGNSVRCVAGGQ